MVQLHEEKLPAAWCFLQPEHQHHLQTHTQHQNTAQNMLLPTVVVYIVLLQREERVVNLMSLHVVPSAYAGDQERLRRGEHRGNKPAVRSSTNTHFILHMHWHRATTAIWQTDMENTLRETQHF